MSRVLVVNDKDNVAVALEGLTRGSEVLVAFPSGGKERRIRVNADIPFGHKLALADIGSGEAVTKYGHTIGVATSRISEGDYVHVHNVASRKGRGDLNTGQD